MKASKLLTPLILALLITSPATAQPILADFRVNENATDRWDQGAPRVLVRGDNNYMIVWRDHRVLAGVFAQPFSGDDNALVDNIHLEGAQSGNNYGDMFAAASDDQGNTVIAWRRLGASPHIMAQRFDNTGTAVGDPFRASDYAGTTEERFASIAYGDSGSFIIVWDDKRADGRGDIYARRFATDGTPLGSDFAVASAAQRQQKPDVASNAHGEFVVTWEDYRIDFNFGDIYAQRLDADGDKAGNNFMVNTEPPANRVRQYTPDVALNDSGTFVIAWRHAGTDHSNPAIHAQRFDSTGDRLGSQITVHDDDGALDRQTPAVAINTTGEVLITWTDQRNGHEDIYLQHYGSDGTRSGANRKINTDEGDATQSAPDVAADSNGDFLIAWWDDRDDGVGSDIYLQRVAGSGSLIRDNFHTTNEETVMVPTFEEAPSIAVDSEGNFMVVWRDQRDRPDIYAQRYEPNGAAIGSNVRVNDDPGDNGQVHPAVGIADNGTALVAWIDSREGANAVYAQFYSVSGEAVGSNFKVTDDSAGVSSFTPAVAAYGSNSYIVLWADTRSDLDIYARRFDGSGVALGDSFKVNDREGSSLYPALAVNDSGQSLIVWSDQNQDNSWDIYAQLHDPEGVAIGSNFQVSADPAAERLWHPAVAAVNNGGFVVAWLDYTNNDIYAQRVAGDGALVNTGFQVGAEGRRQEDPVIASASTGNFIIAWTDNRNEVWPDQQVEVYAQRFHADGTPLGADFKVSANGDLPYEYTPDVALAGNNVYSTWTERDRFDSGTGVDVWVNVLDWDNPVGVAEDRIDPPTREGDTISITWTGGGEAEVAGSIDGPWIPTGNSSGTMTFDINAEAARFLRVVGD